MPNAQGTRESAVSAADETPRLPSLKRNVSWTLFGNVLYSLSSWLMFAVIAKMGTPKMVGQYALGLAVTQPIIMFAQLNLRAVQATDVHKLYRFGHYLALRLAMALLSVVVAVAVALVGHYEAETALVIIAVAVGVAFDSYSDVVYGALQQREQMNRIAISMAVKGPLSLLLLALGLYVGNSVVWAAVGSALASIIVSTSYDYASVRKLFAGGKGELAEIDGLEAKPRWDRGELWNLARLAFPMGITLVLVALNTNIPRFFLEHFAGEAQLGIYAALASVIAAGRIVVNALGQTATPRLARNYAHHEMAKFRELTVWLLVTAVVLGAALTWLAAQYGNRLVASIYTAEYGRYINVFVVSVLSGGVGYLATFIGFALTACRYFKPQVPILLVVCIITSISCAVLVPRLGALGAAYGTLIGMIAQVVASAAALVVVMRDRERQPA